jgi:aminotransferase
LTVPGPSRRADRIAPSAIRRLFDARRPTTINLGFGEPGIPIPMELLDAGFARFRAERPGYPPNAGLPALRERIVAHHRFAHAKTIQNVVVTVGLEEALFATLMAIADPGDEVIIPEPSFVNYRTVAELLGLTVVPVPKPGAKGFALDVEAIRRAIGPKTRAVLLNSPCNPTGRIDRPDELRALVDATASAGAWLVSDEIYAELWFGAERPASIGSFSDRAIVLGALSKTCSFTGLRLGWAVVPDPIARAVAAVHQYNVTCAPTFSQYLAMEAFSDRRWFDSVRPHLSRQREIVLGAIERQWKLPMAPSEGAMYAFVDFRSVAPESIPLAERLLAEADVLTVPGAAFGAAGEGFLRITYGANPTDADTVEGLRRVGAWMSAHASK